MNLPEGGVSTFPYPDECYESCQMIMTPRYMDILDAHTRQLIRYEQRVLAPTKDRFLQRKQSKFVNKITHTSKVDNKINDLYIPEILVDDDVRVQKLRETPGITVVDHVPSMMKELTDGILPKVTDPLLLEEPAHWVYLPWRHIILRILGPKGYKLLRTDRNRYKMTLDEVHQLALRSVGVIGMSVGHSCAVGLAQEALCGHLNLADFDILELPNLNRIPSSITELGSNKTTMTARRIAEIDPYMTINIYKDGVTEENIEDFVKHMDCVVEECDSLDVKILTRFEAAKQRTPVIMEASDLGLLDVERYDIEPNRPPFHGLAGTSLVPQTVKGLSTFDKAPFVLDILELEKLSPRLVASFMEINKTISSWPQLARDVALGGALVSTAVHKLFLDPASLPSGRSRTDLNGALTRLEDPLISEQQHNNSSPEAPVVRRSDLPEDNLEAIYMAAIRAPSGGNTQPFDFCHDENAFYVDAAPPYNSRIDFDYRGTAVACGASLANAAAVASMRGLAMESPIELVEGIRAKEALVNNDKFPVGRVHFNEYANHETDEAWSKLGPFVNKRVSNRQKGPQTPLSSEQAQQLQDCVDDIGGTYVQYTPVDHDKYEVVLDAFMEADRMRMLDSQMHRELFAEFTWPDRGHDLQEGLDIRTLELSETRQSLLRVLEREDSMRLLNEWDVGERIREDTRKNLLASSGIVAVGVRGQGRFEDYVQGGLAMERVWLTATMLGLNVQPWTPVFGYANNFDELSEMIGPSKASVLYPKGRAALDVLGFTEGANQFVMTFRVHKGPPPTAISGRRSPIMMRRGEGQTSIIEDVAV